MDVKEQEREEKATSLSKVIFFDDAFFDEHV